MGWAELKKAKRHCIGQALFSRYMRGNIIQVFEVQNEEWVGGIHIQELEGGGRVRVGRGVLVDEE